MSFDERQLTWSPAAHWAEAGAVPLDDRLAQALLFNITARIAVVDRQQVFRYANRELLKFLGLQAEQLIGRSVADILGQAAATSYAPIAERVYRGEALSWEGWVDYGAFGMRYLQETIVPIALDGSPNTGVVVFGRDHTALKQRERELVVHQHELRTSEALKAAIVDHALAALVSTDVAGRIVEFNPAAEAMFGRSRADVLGREVSSVIMPARFRVAHLAGMARLHAGGAPRVLGQRLQLHALRADGSEFPIEMVLWRTKVGDAVYYTASMVDATERHSAAEQIARQREALRQSEKLTAMGSLLAGVAHELNNPLAIAMGRASLLEEKLGGNVDLQHLLDDVRADVQRIREATERCGRIVRTFLGMARAQPSARASVSVNDLVAAANELLHYTYRTHGIELELGLAPGLPAIHADPDQLGQIVLNLLVNAQQALLGVAGERRVRVASGVDGPAADGGPRVWLRVSDSGPGVPAALRDRIFEPFFTTKPDGIGTGLGLAVSRSLAREHGGDLLLEPPGEGGGASFCLILPVVADAVPAAAPPPPAPRQARATARVLVVDDEVELVGMMCEMLESAGYEVACSESARVALALLDAARFDAIVSDLRMPDMDGAAFFRQVEARHPALARRMLFVTGDTLSPDAREFLKSAHCAVLDKPFTRADLLARVQALLA